MAESKPDYKLGILRLKYLDLSNMAFAQQNPILANGYINDFLQTIKEDSKAGKDIKKQFDETMEKREQQLKELFKATEKLGYLEKKDVENRGRQEIEINTIHDKKTICWSVSMENGLFYE